MNERDLNYPLQPDDTQQPINSINPFTENKDAFYQYYVHITSLHGIPPDIIEKFWGFLNMVHMVTKYKEGNMEAVDNSFEIAWNYYIMSKPDTEYNIEDEMIHANLKSAIMAMVHRSVEGFERKLQATSIHQQITSQIGEQSKGIMGGLKRLFGR